MYILIFKKGLGKVCKKLLKCKFIELKTVPLVNFAFSKYFGSILWKILFQSEYFGKYFGSINIIKMLSQFKVFRWLNYLTD